MLYQFVLLLPSTVSLFWGVFLLCNLRNNLKSQNLLAIGMLMTSFTFLNLAFYIDGVKDYTTYYVLDILDPASLISPVMYLYFRSLTSEKPFGWKDYLWFLPPLIIDSALVILYLIMGEANAVRYSQDILTYGTLLPAYSDLTYKLHYLLSGYLYNVVALIVTVGVCVYALASIVRYHYRLRDFYSSLDDKSIRLNYGVLIWFIIATINAIILFFIHRNFFLDLHVANIFIFIALAVTCFFMGYYGYRIKYTAVNFAFDLAKADHDSEEALADYNKDNVSEPEEEQPGRYRHLALKFKKLIEEDKIFLQSSLRADEVARMVHSNRTYVSRMIHEEFNSNFSDYINVQRIKYSKELMLLNPGMKMNEVAEKSGFINHSSYSRTFKQFTGKPPRKWLDDTYYGNFS